MEFENEFENELFLEFYAAWHLLRTVCTEEDGPLSFSLIASLRQIYLHASQDTRQETHFVYLYAYAFLKCHQNGSSKI